MTVEEFLMLLSRKKDFILAISLAVPLLCILLRLMHGKYMARFSPWKYIYSILVYIVCIPGMFSLSLVAYTLLFLHDNLLALDIYVYYLPIALMVVTLAIIRKSIHFEDLPGFDKLSGLMIIIGITIFVTLILDRLRVFVIFGGSIFSLFIIGIIIFVLLRYAMRLLFGKSKKKRFANRYNTRF